jgi:hypothetical protein
MVLAGINYLRYEVLMSVMVMVIFQVVMWYRLADFYQRSRGTLEPARLYDITTQKTTTCIELIHIPNPWQTL